MEKQRENQIKQWEKKKKKNHNRKEYPRTVDNKICSIRVSKIQKREDRVEHI